MNGSRSYYFKFAFLMLASLPLLTSCFVDKNEFKPNKITFPAQLPTYASNHYISYLYEQYQIGYGTQSTVGSLRQSWSLSAPQRLPSGDVRAGLLRHEFHELKETELGVVDKYSVQHISQDATGSMFVHAFEGASLSTNFWPDENGSLVTTEVPVPMQSFWSPIKKDEDPATPSTVGVNRVENKELKDFHVMGCEGSAVCQSLGIFKFSAYAISNEGIQSVSTPLGNFETYRLEYAGTFSTTQASSSPGPYFDFRVSCGSQSKADTVTFNGSVWIYPPIGIVKISNSCFSTADNTSVYYVANISQTNLPY